MKKNVGNTDRIIRLVAALAIAALLFTGTIAPSSSLGLILAVAGGVFLLTGLLSWCGIYQLVGLSSCPMESKSSPHQH